MPGPTPPEIPRPARHLCAGLVGALAPALTGGLAAAVVAITMAACSRPAEPAASAGDTQVYRQFTLIDGTDRPPVDEAAMVVENGRVAWTGPAAALQAPPSATTIDLGGAVVMPGLIDTHAHLGNTVDLAQDKANYTADSVRQDLRTFASYGVTAVQSMGTDQDAIFAVRQAQRDARPAEARVFTAGQGIIFKGGYGGLAGVNEGVSTPEEAGRAVDAQADKHVDVIKLWLDDELGTMRKMPTAISAAVIQAAHRRNLRAFAHVFYLEDAKRLADQGIDGFVHSVRDKPIDQALIASMKQHGTWQIAATLSREASMFAYGSTPAFAGDPFFTRSVSARTVELIRSPERQKTIAANPHYAKDYPAFLETAKHNVKALADAGVPLGAGTDSGPPGRFPGYFMHWELALLVDAGLTPQQALAAATRRAAEALGAKDLGTLEASKWADFVVLGANPLNDIRNTRAIRSVYVAGREVPAITAGSAP